ncbi:uncharacterized protein A4U43_C04F8010 [Asparagus officinalis]|uniref:Agenet domain-containing protein n=1 Tax=Asparagus officinalis TaxID=4686 RepID=A0A5P1EZ61_ASPOF|nr:uncharacterized protein A4U43_C04F8010 [Asparagus officinalis]
MLKWRSDRRRHRVSRRRVARASQSSETPRVQRSGHLSLKLLLIARRGLRSNLSKKRSFTYKIRRGKAAGDPAAGFELHQCVEAFHSEVWWKGVVTKVPERDGDLLYSVCFPESREEFQFKASEIRRQMKWAKGKWIDVEDDDQVTSLSS